jgi:bifunctional DNA-binding transcriptional regulator/antitoxin component of YhaV-PrlF toxin-antitoxin module
MPQLVKGGKYVFGWSPVGSEGGIRIPEEAVQEYGFEHGEKLIIMSGSRTSGGFIIARKSVMEQTILSNILTKKPELADFKTEKGKTVSFGKRHLCWTEINDNGNISFPPETLEKYGVHPGDRLLSGRGSYAGVAMIVRGPIVDEALNHPELSVFIP